MAEKMIPVLQMDDIEALKAAMKHLEENGYNDETSDRRYRAGVFHNDRVDRDGNTGNRGNA